MKKDKTVQWRAKNIVKQSVVAKEKKMVEEAHSVIILDTFERQRNINMENLENHVFEGGKEDQIGKDEREWQNFNHDEQQIDNLEEGEIQAVLHTKEEEASKCMMEKTNRDFPRSNYEDA